MGNQISNQNTYSAVISSMIVLVESRARVHTKSTMTSLHDASGIVSLASSVLSGAKSAADLANLSKDRELKNKLNELLDDILQLKIKANELDEENRELRIQLEKRVSVKRQGEFGYFFKDGDSEPLCPKCLQSSSKEVYLTPLQTFSGGLRRKCLVCNETFWESPARQPRAQIQTNWMG